MHTVDTQNLHDPIQILPGATLYQGHAGFLTSTASRKVTLHDPNFDLCDDFLILSPTQCTAAADERRYPEGPWGSLSRSNVADWFRGFGYWGSGVLVPLKYIEYGIYGELFMI